MTDQATPGDQPDLPEQVDPSGFDLGSLLGQAQAMMEATAEAAGEVVDGNAGGGAVRVTVNGRFEFQSVTISPEAIATGDAALLEDMVLAALRDATAKIAERQQQALGGFGDLGGLLGG